MAGLLGAGDIFIGEYDSAETFLGYGPKINGVDIEINPGEGDNVPRRSKGRDNYGSVLDSVTDTGLPTVNLAVDDITKDTLTLALNGASSDVSISAGNFTDLQRVARHDKWVETGHVNVSKTGLVVGDDAVPTTTYILGTDYEFDHRLGLFKALSGGSITDGQTVYIDGAVVATTGYNINGSTGANKKYKILFDGINRANKKRIEIVIEKIPLAPAQGINFLNDEFIQASVTGQPEATTDRPGGYSYRYLGDEATL